MSENQHQHPNVDNGEDTERFSQKTDPPAAPGSAHWRIATVVSLALIAAAFFGWRYSLQLELRQARKAASRGSWQGVVGHLDRYLHYRPEDAAAQLLMAEAYVRAQGRDFETSVRRAVFHLQQIPDESELAARARLQEGRLSLFLLKRPAAAERLLKAALDLDPDSAEANHLMWQLLDVTGRHVLSDPYFWRVYELSPESQRGLLLRDWFLSEFYPEDLHAGLFQQMGVSAVGNIPASVNLLVRFREVEPEASFLHAALANYYHDLGNLNATMDLLKECPDVSAAMSDPFFVSVLFEALVDLGEFPRAEDCFQQFPQPHEGYLYWRSESMYYDYVKDDSAAAVGSLRKALATPPARFDWGLMTRLSVCLRKTGASQEAKEMQARVDDLTRNVLTVEHASLLRKLLSEPEQPGVAAKLSDFYGKFHLEREVSAWNDYKYYLANEHRPSGP